MQREEWVSFTPSQFTKGVNVGVNGCLSCAWMQPCDEVEACLGHFLTLFTVSRVELPTVILNRIEA